MSYSLIPLYSATEEYVAKCSGNEEKSMSLSVLNITQRHTESGMLLSIATYSSVAE